MNLDAVIPEAASPSYPEKGCVVTAGAHNNRHVFTVGNKGGMFFFYPHLWSDFDNNLLLIDLDNSIHSQILLNNNLRVLCVA